MTHTALGLFRTSIEAEKAVSELKAAGFTAGDLRVTAEPRYMPVSSPLSTPSMDLCEELTLDLRAMGVPEPEAQTYILGVRNGGSLVFANGSIEQAHKAAEIMNLHHAATAEEIKGLQPELPELPHDSAIHPNLDSGEGARLFAW